MNDRDCIALLQWALPRLNHRWEGYRRVRRQVCRRIAARMQALGLADVAAYRARLEADAAEWTALRSCLKVIVSRFVRDRGVFHALSHSIFPALAEMALKARSPTVSTCFGPSTCKNAGRNCACPSWPPTLMPGCCAVHRWPATPPAVSGKSPGIGWGRASCATTAAFVCVPHCARRCDSILRQDLCEELPDDTFHLILCRNLAFTYFAEPLQQEIARNLLGRLMPGGCLILGTHERLPTGSEAVTTYGEAAGIYWKTAPGPAAARGDGPADLGQGG